jgi:hypothetical protein
MDLEIPHSSRAMALGFAALCHPGFRFPLLLLFLLVMAKNRPIVLGSRHVLGR